MKYTGPIMLLMFAVLAAYAATGTEFYGGGVGRKAANNPIPKWFGRLWFLAFSAAAAYMGIKALLTLSHH